MPKAVDEEVSMFGYYVAAARVAAALNIGLGYAFEKYVKPKIPADRDIPQFTPEEYRAFAPTSE